MFVATVIAAGSLTQRHLSFAVDALADAGCNPGRTRWVQPGSAVDVLFNNDPAAARMALQSWSRWAVDVVVQHRSGREKRLLVADMDSTMITVECIDELADYAGVKAEVAAVTEAAMRGELDFAGALAARVRLLAGLEEGTIDRCLTERVRPTPGARTLVQTMKARGATCLLVSGGFTRFAEPVAAQLGFGRVLANRLEIVEGRLTGAVLPPIVDAQAKATALSDGMAELGLAPEAVMAVGDGANDLPMIRAAGLGVAYRAKPALRDAADAAIEANDLTALLYAQGVPRDAWVG